jgi:hypothetical protein
MPQMWQTTQTLAEKTFSTRVVINKDKCQNQSKYKIKFRGNFRKHPPPPPPLPTSSLSHKTLMSGKKKKKKTLIYPLDLLFPITFDPLMPKTAQNCVVLRPKKGVILGLKMVSLGFRGSK